jgi:hypothetical protein
VSPLRPEIAELLAQGEAARAEARALCDGLSEAQLLWRPSPGAWSIAECLDHLARAGVWFVKQAGHGLEQARARGLRAEGPYRLRPFDRLAASVLEPPVRYLRARAPRGAVPATITDPRAALAAFEQLQDSLVARVRECDGWDLRRARVRSPWHPAIKLSLGGLLLVTLAHERRHLWQARGVRAAEGFPRG